MNIKGMLAALVLAGSAAAMAGCNQALPSTSDSTDAAATDSAANEATNWFSYHAHFGGPIVARPVVGGYWRGGYAHFGPPAARYEVIGRAPSARHFWSPGYYRWSGARYSWIGGRWDIRRPGLHFVPAHYSRIGGYYHFVPGHFVR